MSLHQQTTGDRLNVFLEQIELPEKQDTLEALIANLESATHEVLTKYDGEAEGAKVIAGHTHTQIEAHGPSCREDLKLIGLQPDSRNGAFASASCQCGWYGESVYRLVDLYEAQPADLTTDSILGMIENSSVRNLETIPRYYPYGRILGRTSLVICTSLPFFLLLMGYRIRPFLGRKWR